MISPEEVMSGLRERLGAGAVLDSAADRFLHSTDASRRRGSCLGIVRVRTEEDVVVLAKAARELGFHLVPRGAGTSPTGSALPQGRAVVLDLTCMNRILEVSPRDQLVVVEPGVLTGTLQKEVEARGLFYPPDPASSRFSTIGGNVATCAGGLRALKYGVTRDYVLGVRGVLADGSVLETGGRNLKDVAGYDLTRLLVGSEGTLIVFTRLILRLIPRPETSGTIVASFPTLAGGLAAADAILEAGLLPRALEYLDEDVLAIVAAYLGRPVDEGAASQLLVEVDGGPAQVEQDLERTLRVLQGCNARNVRSAAAGPESDAVWEARRSISAAVFKVTPAKMSQDIGVPRSRLGETICAVKAVGRRHRIRVLAYGHAGDANVHCNFLYDPEEAGVSERLDRAVREAFQEVASRGGTVSGEHGIGLAKREALAEMLPKQTLAIHRGIKDLFDPDGILNPGKILMSPGETDLDGGEKQPCVS